MSLLDQHHCARAEAPPRRPPPDSLRVDIQAAGRQATYEQSLSARSPMYPGKCRGGFVKLGNSADFTPSLP